MQNPTPQRSKTIAIIATFRLKDGKWTGNIRTLTIDIQLHTVPVKDRPDGAPDFRIVAGEAEPGGAWCEESRDGETPYLAVKLDDPALAVPVRAAFFEQEKGAAGIRVGSRARAA